MVTIAVILTASFIAVGAVAVVAFAFVVHARHDHDHQKDMAQQFRKMSETQAQPKVTSLAIAEPGRLPIHVTAPAPIPIPERKTPEKRHCAICDRDFNPGVYVRHMRAHQGRKY